MPLQFESINHGLIAFGFFNIESDMLLLENNFIFASDFCRNIVELSQKATEKGLDTDWTVWQIETRADMGDFMGAMNGFRYTGFFGELYTKYPFPKLRIDFKQKPDGWKTQTDVKQIIDKYGKLKSIHIHVDEGFERIDIGNYAFTKTVFVELIRYVWQGGFPQWKDGVRPGYVADMIAQIMDHNLLLNSELAID